MSTCEALGCARTDVRPHTLKKTSGFEFPAEAVLCPEHIAITSNPSSEWIFSPDGMPRTLLVGNDLSTLDEYVVTHLDASIGSGSTLRVEAPVVDDGYYLTLHARRRGEPSPTAMKLQIPLGQEKKIAQQLEEVAGLLRTMPDIE
ncbi:MULTISPECIES: hypothetical protein [Rhodococcus]|uniref:Uncharacterized protein n=1 Tax=Rhodococcus sp. NS1 TaxID=402236 RepID=A0A097SPN0_9NOCA|nr:MULTISPECIES: hypothetical protein [Rhodococcus]AIU93477.1 hypothetical protein LRS1606.43 [Rhodococcus sp. NS1]MDO1481497.1 hypothetical protein [Rhodococcus ruber]